MGELIEALILMVGVTAILYIFIIVFMAGTLNGKRDPVEKIRTEIERKYGIM